MTSRHYRKQGGPMFPLQSEAPVVDVSIQYVVTLEDGKHTVRRFQEGQVVGRVIAQHSNLGSVRVAIPSSHVKAKAPVEAPIVEVWIDRSIEQ